MRGAVLMMLLMGVFLVGCGGEEEAAPPPATDGEIRQGVFLADELSDSQINDLEMGCMSENAPGELVDEAIMAEQNTETKYTAADYLYNRGICVEEVNAVIDAN